MILCIYLEYLKIFITIICLNFYISKYIVISLKAVIKYYSLLTPWYYKVLITRGTL